MRTWLRPRQAQLRDPNAVGNTIAASIGITGAAVGDRLFRALRGSRLLLILDNFEHLIRRHQYLRLDRCGPGVDDRKDRGARGPGCRPSPRRRRRQLRFGSWPPIWPSLMGCACRLCAMRRAASVGWPWERACCRASRSSRELPGITPAQRSRKNSLGSPWTRAGPAVSESEPPKRTGDHPGAIVQASTADGEDRVPK